jgi:hypothetical protein
VTSFCASSLSSDKIFTCPQLDLRIFCTSSMVKTPLLLMIDRDTLDCTSLIDIYIIRNSCLKILKRLYSYLELSCCSVHNNETLCRAGLRGGPAVQSSGAPNYKGCPH